MRKKKTIILNLREGRTIKITLSQQRYSSHLSSTFSSCLSKFINPSSYSIRSFKFHLRWDLDEPILFSYKCKIDEPMCSLELMTELKAQKVDILKLIAEQSHMYYSELSTLWTLHYDFRGAL